MARKTDGEKIDELEKVVAGILKRLDNVEKSVDDLNNAGKEIVQGLNNLQRVCETGLAILKKDIEELRRWTEKNGTADVKSEVHVLKEKTAKLETAQEKAGNRAWSVVPNVVGALLSGAIAAVVAYFVARR